MRQVLHYEIMDVSIQRLAELYPDETERNAKKFQCEKCGVTIFDANDEAAKKKALQNQEGLKEALTEFSF